jgi:regulator of nonsense transcripts 1
MRWKRKFSTDDRLANLFEVIAKSFSEFHRKLLVLKVHERLIVAIYIQQQIAPEEEILVGQGVRFIAFPHTQKPGNCRGRIHATKPTYHLYYDHNVFQLYQSRRQNTFVWIGRPGKNHFSYKNVQGVANRNRKRQKTIDAGLNRDWVTSIALDRFSAHTKTQIGRVYRDHIAAAVNDYLECRQSMIVVITARTESAYKIQELYVISNTDVKSFQVLDLWMESVDTMETIPLFEKAPPPLTIPELAMADLTSQPDEIRGFFESGDISLLEGLIQGLVYTPGHVVFFAALSPWQENFPGSLSRTLNAQSLRLLKATLQATNAIDMFALDTMKTILGEVDSLSLESFQEIVEGACLLIKSPDQLLDIYLDALAHTSERLIHESPP